MIMNFEHTLFICLALKDPFVIILSNEKMEIDCS